MALKTPLHPCHMLLGTKMGEFAGYDMPLYYGLGVMKEHLWVRHHAGLFDVSHMGQVILEGDGVAEFLETITPSAFQNKPLSRAQYTVLTNETGGIIDDLIITRLAENKFFLVINAGCKDKDIAWIKKHCPPSVTLNYLDPRGLIALQGPSAARVTQDLLNIDVSDLAYMHARETAAPCGTEIIVSRLGYTGEDGFEISMPAARAPDLWDLLLSDPEVEAIGLAARDSLRLEMGYPLYGHDIDQTTSPIEAGLGWIVSKNNTGYFGYDRISQERENGVARRRVGIKLTEKGVAREGAELRDQNDQMIGILTSGGFSPSLQCAVGQGYVPENLARVGSPVFVHVRGRNIPAEITDMPFIQPKTKPMKTQKVA